MLREFMMFINASINMDHRQFTFQLENVFCALSVLEEKYIFKYKWVKMEDCACIIFQIQNRFYKSHNSIYKSGMFLKSRVNTQHNSICVHACAAFPYMSQVGLSVCCMHRREHGEINSER